MDLRVLTQFCWRAGQINCAVLCLAATPALAHGDHGNGGDGGVLPQGTTVVTAQYDFITYRQISDERLGAYAVSGIGGIHSLTTIAVPTMSLARGLTKDFTVGVRVPYLINSGISESNADTGLVDARGGVRGFGDVSMTGTYRFYNDAQLGLTGAAIFGIKAPTGRTNATDAFGDLFEAEHQPGSGSWDPMIGGAVSSTRGPWTLGANVLFTRAGLGSQDTRLGDRFAYGLSASYLLSGVAVHDRPMKLGTAPFDGMMRHGGVEHASPAAPAPSLEATLAINGQWSGKQMIAGIRDDNTGANTVFLTPGLRLSVDRWSTFLNVGIPIANHSNGVQSDPTLQVTSGVAVRF